MSGNKLYAFKTSFADYCASHKFISIGLEMSLETIISKKAILPVKKDFGPIFLVLSMVTHLTN